MKLTLSSPNGAPQTGKGSAYIIRCLSEAIFDEVTRQSAFEYLDRYITITGCDTVDLLTNDDALVREVADHIYSTSSTVRVLKNGKRVGKSSVGFKTIDVIAYSYLEAVLASQGSELALSRMVLDKFLTGYNALYKAPQQDSKFVRYPVGIESSIIPVFMKRGEVPSTEKAVLEEQLTALLESNPSAFVKGVFFDPTQVMFEANADICQPIADALTITIRATQRQRTLDIKKS